MTPILLNDFKLQWESVRSDFLDSSDRVGQSGHLILGTEVGEFEKALSAFWGISFSVGCASGLDAIEIALRVLGLKPKDKVLTTPLSAFATTLAIIRAGGRPIFCDTDESGLIDLDLAEEILESDPEIKFLVPVHLFGHVVNLKKLQKLKHQYGIKIVEDCAQSIGARSNGQPTGSVGDLAATSFYPTKNLGCYGDGGAVLTNDQKFYEIAKSLRDYGQVEKYKHAILGLNSRLDELQAAILRSALLPRLNVWAERRNQIAEKYQKNIKHPLIKLVPQPSGSRSSWHLFPVLTPKREFLRKWLMDNQIQTGIHYPILIPEQPVFDAQDTKSLVEIRGSLSQAEKLVNEELSLPIHPFLKDVEIDRVIEACNTWKVSP